MSTRNPAADPEPYVFTYGPSGGGNRHTPGGTDPATGVTFCAQHPGIALTEYDGRPWCRVCAAEEFAYVEQYRRGLAAAQWILALTVPLVLFGWAGLAPYRPGANPQGAAFWAWLLPPTAFLATFLTVLTGHFGLRAWFKRRASNSAGTAKGKGGEVKAGTGPLRWFHPTHLLRDLALIALVIGILYTLLVFLGPKYGLPTGKIVQRLPGWLLYRGAPLFLVSAGALYLLCRSRLVNEDALLPLTEGRRRWLFLYAALLPPAFLIMQRWLETWARARPGPWFFLVGLLALLASIGFYGWTLREFLSERRRRDVENPTSGTFYAAPSPRKTSAPCVPVTIALVGPPSSGKTVFLARAYERMRGVLGGVFAIAPSDESERALAPVRYRLETLRRWPDPTAATPKEIPFGLRHLADEVARFHWLDLPGGTFTYTDPHAPEYVPFETARRRFAAQLGSADGLLFVFDAELVASHMNADALPHEDIYINVCAELFARLERLGPAARPVPLAIVVTKCDKIAPRDRERLPARLAFLGRYYREMAASKGLAAPPVRLFMTIAVRAGQDDYGEWSPPPVGQPIESENVREPVLWLASQTLRAHVGALDFVLGFQNRSPLQAVIVRMEALAG